ncbi:Fe(3+)-citrate-binding protein YfmC precursor [Paenibacillus konkukensis]|uniref:Fe(3+)-citrate-binding protein YfmC n=1 Tax=Paenibacillus konkukensis TaxID=2020716 RepID=A0ABY4RGE9_9BACL|nr:ABC transporter substrate-binding protein [Paenibacillus konkukensis]UQZ81546.1 Fe(3+)-citrate-binding protein YfmC precursor [Paenibacillus konkukensis]
MLSKPRYASYITVVSTLLAIALLSGCGTEPAGTAPAGRGELPDAPAAVNASGGNNSQEAAVFAQWEDSTGKQVVLHKKPERIVVLNPEYLDLLYSVGGQAVGRTDTPDIQPPKGAEQAVSVGQLSSPSLEQLVALKPDLVIGHPQFHSSLQEALAASGIPLALMRLNSYEDIIRQTQLMGKLAGTEPHATELLAALDGRLQQLLFKRPAETKTFAMMNVTPASISLQRSDTTGLEIAKLLKLTNVAETLTPSQKSPTTTPYSLEKLVELDPDYIFIVIHGSKDTGERKIKSDLQSNPAWSSLRAVKEGRMIIAPSSLFLTNPGLKLDESVLYMGKLVYPEIYGHAD